MATLLDTQPVKIETTECGQYLFIYAAQQDLEMLPVGSEYLVVYAPTQYSPKGCVIRYRIEINDQTAAVAALDRARPLTSEEIMHFEGMIAGY
jgi:hypothetical protein